MLSVSEFIGPFQIETATYTFSKQCTAGGENAITSHLISGWEWKCKGKRLKIGGGLFVSDLNPLIFCDMHPDKKERVIIDSLSALLKSKCLGGTYDVLVIGYPLPLRYRKGVRSVDDIDVDEIIATSQTSRILTGPPLSASLVVRSSNIKRLPIFAEPGTSFGEHLAFCNFVIAEDNNVRRIVEDEIFCSVAAIPLEADFEEELNLIQRGTQDIELVDARREVSLRACESIFGCHF